MESASFNLVLDCVAAKRFPLILNNRPETIDIKKNYHIESLFFDDDNDAATAAATAAAFISNIFAKSQRHDASVLNI